MSRWKAAGIHLVLSALVIVGAILGLVFAWYPPEYLRMAKVFDLVLILGSVDLVIGPLLTLIIFKRDLRLLRFDLACIGLLQVAALAYGVHTMWASRPVFLVAVPDRFELVYANEITDQHLAEARDPAYRVLPWNGPLMVGAPLPDDPKEREDILLSAVAGQDLQQLPRYYVSYDSIAAELLGNAQPITGSGQAPADALQAMRERARALGLDPAQLRFVPIVSSRGIATMLLRASDGSVVGPVDADPWGDE